MGSLYHDSGSFGIGQYPRQAGLAVLNTRSDTY